MALVAWPEFCGGTYRFPADPLLGVDSCKNRMPVKMGRTGKGEFGLQPIPGKELKVTLATSPGRGIWSGDDGIIYAVSGDKLYRIDGQTYAVTSPGVAVGNNSSPVQFTHNGLSQLGLQSNNKLYVDSGAGPVEITTCPAAVSAGGQGVGGIVYSGGYGICFELNTNKVYVSALGDLTTWDVLDVQIWYASQDRLIMLTVDKNGIVWLWGRKTFEPWQQLANPGTRFPFARVPGASSSVGVAARFSIGLVPQLNGPDQQCWLSQNERGSMSVYTLQGYQAVRISTDAIEAIIAQWAVVSDCIMNGYWMAGHRLALFSFPDAAAMLAYDFNTGMWHERYSGSWGSYVEPLGRYHTAPVVLPGRHYWLSGTSGKLYLDNATVYTDEGNPIYWERIGPNAHNAQQEMVCGLFRLDVQTGVGTSSTGITLEVSRDEGKTWSTARARSTGAPGDYAKALDWNRNGEGRSFIPRIRGVDPIAAVIVGASVDLDPGLGY